MKKKGVVPLVSIMIGFLLIIAIIAIAPSMQEQVSLGRTSLNCSVSENLSAAETGTCIVVDWLFFGFVGLGLIIGITWLIARKIRTRNEFGG